jgi:hypothetical protein
MDSKDLLITISGTECIEGEKGYANTKEFMYIVKDSDCAPSRIDAVIKVLSAYNKAVFEESEQSKFPIIDNIEIEFAPDYYGVED